MTVATVNFSVPQEVKDAFDRTFRGRNKSAILAELMRRAVTEERLRARRLRAFDEIEAMRPLRQPVSNATVAEAREALRK